ncbi:MAG TPA: hypothetical protein VKR31_06680 [Rhizomicrobium sp.]|nr:hypothetical protein [Rhizomicrobium sp.]
MVQSYVMAAGERFLSVRLGPQHSSKRLDFARTDALMLELERHQWILYFMANNEITGYRLPASLDAARGFAWEVFGIRPDEWIEDSDN